MTITIDATIGGAAANSYNSLAEVSAFAETMSPADFALWDALDDDDAKPLYMARAAKPLYMARAARLLDTVPFPGTMATATQLRQWPRYDVEAPSGFGYSYGIGFSAGYYYPPTVIPQAVKDAHAQLSVYLATQTAEAFGTGDAGALSGLKVGPINVNFRADSASAPTTGRDYLQREIYPLLAAGNCVGSSRSVRLTR